MVYNVSWVEAGEGEGTTMMTTMTTMETTTMTKTNINMDIKIFFLGHKVDDHQHEQVKPLAWLLGVNEV